MKSISLFPDLPAPPLKREPTRFSPIEANLELQKILNGVPKLNLLLRAYGEDSHARFWVKSHSGHFLYATKGFYRKVGLHTASEILGRSDFDLFPAFIAAAREATDRMTMATRTKNRGVCEPHFCLNYGATWDRTIKTSLVDCCGRVVGISGLALLDHSEITRKMPEREAGVPGDLLGGGGIEFAFWELLLTQIVKNCSSKFTIAQFARSLRLAQSSLRKRTADDFGLDPSKVIGFTRIAVASRAMVRDRTCLKKAACLSGFCSPSAFGKKFREMTDTTPGQFAHALRDARRAHGNDRNHDDSSSMEKIPHLIPFTP